MLGFFLGASTMDGRVKPMMKEWQRTSVLMERNHPSIITKPLLLAALEPVEPYCPQCPSDRENSRFGPYWLGGLNQLLFCRIKWFQHFIDQMSADLLPCQRPWLVPEWVQLGQLWDGLWL